MPQTFKGKTEDAEAPFLPFAVGTRITGKISKVFTVARDGKNGEQGENVCYQIDLDDPVEIDGEEWERVSVGERAGIRMAMQAANMSTHLRVGDAIELECTGSKPSKKVDPKTGEPYSPRLNFSLIVVRN